MPTVAFWTFILTFASFVIHMIAKSNRAFANFMNFEVNHVFRSILAHLTGWIPFSLAEFLILGIPVIAVVIFYFGARIAKKSWRYVIRYILGLLSVVCYFYISFVFTYGIGYVTTPAEDVLGFDRQDVSVVELRNTALVLAFEINDLVPMVDFAYGGSSYMPYTLDEMSEKLCEAYETFCEKAYYVNTFKSRVKPVAMSEALTYTHLAGIYSYMTGESNLNVHFPDFTLPFTAAHEMAHQRGFAREDEANFVAFLVCMESDDPYIRYCGAMGVYVYVVNALYQADPNVYYEVSGALHPSAHGENNAYSAFFKKYEDAPAATVTDKINDAYLQIQGTPGTKSYGMVVDLVVAYYRAVNWGMPVN